MYADAKEYPDEKIYPESKWATYPSKKSDSINDSDLYESTVLDQSCQKIIEAIKGSGLEAVGPVPMPTKIRRYCVLTSPHVNKDAREHFEIKKYSESKRAGRNCQ